MNIYDDYCPDQITLLKQGDMFLQLLPAGNPEREDRKVLMNFWAHFNFPSRGINFFLPSHGPGNRDWLLGNQLRDFPAARINWPSQDFPSGFSHPLLGKRSTKPALT